MKIIVKQKIQVKDDQSTCKELTSTLQSNDRVYTGDKFVGFDKREYEIINSSISTDKAECYVEIKSLLEFSTIENLNYYIDCATSNNWKCLG